MAPLSHRAALCNTRLARKHIDWLADLPEPPATFRATDVPAACKTDLRDLARTATIEVVGEEPYPDTEGSRRVYQLSEAATEEIAGILEHRQTPCPCGHSGLRNHGSYYTCQYEPCDRTFDRSDIDMEGL